MAEIVAEKWSTNHPNKFNQQNPKWRLCKKKTSGYAMWFTAAPKPLKIQVLGGHPAPRGCTAPIFYGGNTTRPRHVTYVLVWSKSDQRRLRKTLHKETDRQTDTTKIMVTWPWTNTQTYKSEDKPGQPWNFDTIIIKYLFASRNVLCCIQC